MCVYCLLAVRLSSMNRHGIGPRLDKSTLDRVQKQLVDNSVDVGETILECSLIDNDRGGTFFVKFERLETVMRVWDTHCSWWDFDFKRQGERELTALQLASKAGVTCPEVLASGQVDLVRKIEVNTSKKVYLSN